MRVTISAILLSVLCFIASVSSAEELEVWHGWMNLEPCLTVEYPNGWPEFYSYPKELHGYIFADVDNAEELANRIKNDCISCGIRAAAATTTVALLTSGLGGWETFTAVFADCMDARWNGYVPALRFASETICAD